MHYEKKNANLATFFLYCLHFNVSLQKINTLECYGTKSNHINPTGKRTGKCTF